MVEPPSSTFRVLLPFPIAGVPEGVEVKRRRLNPSELAELKAKAGQLQRVSGGFWLLTLLAAAVGWAWVHGGMPIPPSPISQVFPPGLWLFSVYELVRNRWRAGRIERDIALGWVVTVDSTQPGVPAGETLLHTRFDWTVEGEPARWRGARWFCTLLIDRR